MDKVYGLIINNNLATARFFKTLEGVQKEFKTIRNDMTTRGFPRLNITTNKPDLAIGYYGWEEKQWRMQIREIPLED